MKSVRKKGYRILAAVILIVVLVQSTVWAEETAQSTTINSSAVSLQTPSAILMEASTGTVLFEKNPDEMRSPASITKIMTLLLTFEALEKGRIK
ncbi:MAG: D-alanyl-D-alanine carboxypeptidase, partial [Lachnospiraceae bacterium]|nr:D-alanyl-D-alanine carboxypeptidase [Lachnospiraceae bacterium]